MHPNCRHPEISSILAAKFLGEGESPEASLVSELTTLMKESLPIFAGKTLVIPVCPGMLSPMVEEAVVIILILQRSDFFGYEVVEGLNIRDEVGRKAEGHRAVLGVRGHLYLVFGNFRIIKKNLTFIIKMY